MTIQEELEVDIMRFFEQIESQDFNDKKKTLRLLLDKYIHLSTTTYLMDEKDLSSIISFAKSSIVSKTLPIYLGERKRIVDQSDQANLCVIESTIKHLNKNECLKRMPKFDYKENK